MEGAGVCPAIALSMIASGEDQVIVIDHRTILKKVMEALGATEPPIYTFYDCGSNGWRVSIKLKVITAKFHLGQTMHFAEIEGDTSETRFGAAKNAVMKSVQYLKDKHKINIYDFSSRLSRELDDSSAFGDLNAAVFSVGRLLEKLEVIMEKTEIAATKLAAKEAAAKVDTVSTGPAMIFEGFHQDMQMVVDVYKPKLSMARGTANAIEYERQKYHKACTEKYQGMLVKGQLQDVCLEAKDVLEYVLTYIGASKPTYSNGPNSENSMDGFVEFNVPKAYGLEICGNLKITGKATRSMAAEEEAAFNALVYMEKKYKLKIVDLNHSLRVQTEKEQKLLVRLLDNLLNVADDVKRFWAKMNKNISGNKRRCNMAATDTYASEGSPDKKEAYDFCFNCFEELEEESIRSFNACASRFEEFGNLRCKLHDLKDMLEMD